MKIFWTTYPNGYNTDKKQYKFSLVANLALEENTNREIRLFQKAYFEMLSSNNRPVKFQIRKGTVVTEFNIADFQNFITQRAETEKLWNYLFTAGNDESPGMIRAAGVPGTAPILLFEDFHAEFFKVQPKGPGFNPQSPGTSLIDDMLDYYNAFANKPKGFQPSGAAAAEIKSDRISSILDRRNEKFTDIFKSAGRSGITPSGTERVKYYHALAKLAEYPDLMRRLGLIIDFEIDQPMLDTNEALQFRILIDTSGISLLTSETDDIRFPYTVFSNQYVGDKGRADIKNCGGLELKAFKPGDYRLLQFEPDDYAKLLGQKANSAESTPAFLSLSKGFQLFLNSRENEKADMNGVMQPVLTAANSTIGYRVDVAVTKNGTTDVCSLTDQYLSFKAIKPNIIRDEESKDKEGWVTIDAGMKSKETADSVTYQLSNKLFSWDGYSLVCHFPLQLGDDESDTTEGGMDISVRYLDEKIKIEKQAVEGSIIPLRFNQAFKYAFRMRSVLPNGYSFTIAQAAEIEAKAQLNCTTEAQNFVRQELVKPPLFILTESLMEQVTDKTQKIAKYPVGNREGESLHVMAIRNYNNSNSTPQKSARYIIPPQTTFQLAEWHGKFDDFYKRGKARIIRDCYRASLATLPTVIERDFNNYKPFDNMYLPDPACDGFMIDCIGIRILPKDLEGKRDEIIGLYSFIDADKEKLSFDLSSYPKFRPWMVHLEGLEDTMHEALRKKNKLYKIATGQHSITYYLPKGYEIDFIITCTSLYSDGVFAVNSQYRFVQQKFTMLHAVQLPMIEPVLEDYELLRLKTRSDKSKVQFKPKKIKYDELSAESLELHARWKEYDDSNLAVIDPEIPVQDEGMEFSNILKKDAIYTDGEKKEISSYSLLFSDNIITEQRDSRFRKKDFYLRAVSRFSEFYLNSNPALSEEMKALKLSLDGPVSEFPLKVENVAKFVLNNEKPSPPKIAYIIPVLTWTDDTNDEKKVRKRTGNQLRMFFELGNMYDAGEEIQIALKTKKTGSAEQDYSRIGQDITVDRVRDNGNLNSDNIGWAVNAENDGAEQISIVTYRPKYSSEQDLWYVDITIPNDQYYFPFVQFYVAKFQPYSSDAAYRFSSFVKSDFAQFSPERRVFMSGTNNRITVGFAIKKTNNAKLPNRRQNKVTVILEARHNRSRNNELLWYVKDQKQFDDLFNITTSQLTVIGNFQYVVMENIFALTDAAHEEYRLVVEEHERFLNTVDGDTPSYNERLVYMDVMPILT